jgi:uncharacterized protein YifE (UPF0438 family)
MRDKHYQRVVKALHRAGAAFGSLDLDGFLARSGAALLLVDNNERRPSFEKNEERLKILRDLATQAKTFETTHRRLLALEKV